MFLKYFSKQDPKIIMKQKKYINISFLKIIMYTILFNSPFITASILADDNKTQIKFEEFEDVFIRNDIKYENKDSYSSQINSFFGINYSLENRNFRDLSIPFHSRDIKELYNYKLIQMSVKESDNLNDDFFKDKL